MTEQKAFYEIEKPKRTTDVIFHLIELNREMDGWTCMHTIPVHNAPGRRKRCPTKADETCEFCGMWTCHTHFAPWTRIWIEDNSGFTGASGFYATPCTNCNTLPKDDLLKLRALRLELNRA